MTIFSRQFCIGGSVVEFSPATREARVRFPANATSFFGGFIFDFRANAESNFNLSIDCIVPNHMLQATAAYSLSIVVVMTCSYRGCANQTLIEIFYQDIKALPHDKVCVAISSAVLYLLPGALGLRAKANQLLVF